MLVLCFLKKRRFKFFAPVDSVSEAWDYTLNFAGSFLVIRITLPCEVYCEDVAVPCWRQVNIVPFNAAYLADVQWVPKLISLLKKELYNSCEIVNREEKLRVNLIIRRVCLRHRVEQLFTPDAETTALTVSKVGFTRAWTRFMHELSPTYLLLRDVPLFANLAQPDRVEFFFSPVCEKRDKLELSV